MDKNKNVPNITMTVIFEGSALNRNEKIGGNILSVKKLNVNGQEKTYLSKGAIRHYLFNTLIRAYKWKEAKILPDGQVLQFDIKLDDILTCEELDVFGYMNTTQGQTRKTPLHITKAISLFPYEQDMGMYANHDLVRRAKEQGTLDTSANPNPFSKEEHTSFYKITFTIDADKLGEDTWIVPKVDIEDNLIVLKNIEGKEGDVEEESDGTKKAQSEKKDKKPKKVKEEIIRKISFQKQPNKEKNIYEVENGTIEFNQLPNKKFKVNFKLSSDKHIKRIKEILSTIQNGLIAHSSSESNTIVPIFMICADVKVPSPIFHSFIDVKRNNDDQFEVIGIKDALKNGWLEHNIYLQDCERLKASYPKTNNLEKEKNPENQLTRHENWNEFLTAVLPETKKDESTKS